MKLNISDIEGQSAYQAFLLYVESPATLKDYKCYLRMFLDSIPTAIYTKNNINLRNNSDEDKAENFITLAKNNTEITKNIIHAYVIENKRQVAEKIIAPATLRSRVKPIKALLASNEIPFFWKNLNRGMPKPGKGKDRAYTIPELQDMMKHATDVMDKVIITMFSSGGFRLAAWNDLTWEDVRFFYYTTNEIKENNYSRDQLKGMAIRIYRGDVEEYWTHGTPEAAKYLLLYREQWKSHFGAYPDKSDPLIYPKNSIVIKRLTPRAIAARVLAILIKCNLRPPLEEGQKRHTVMADHGFRKFTNTMMRRAKVNFADKEDMQGRKIGQEASYERYVENDFERWPEYQKAIPFLTISDEERNLLQIRAKDKELADMDIVIQTKIKKLETQHEADKKKWAKQQVSRKQVDDIWEALEELKKKKTS